MRRTPLRSLEGQELNDDGGSDFDELCSTSLDPSDLGVQELNDDGGSDFDELCSTALDPSDWETTERERESEDPGCDVLTGGIHCMVVLPMTSSSPFARSSKVLAHNSVDRVRMIRIGAIEQLAAAVMDTLPKAFRTVVSELPWTQFL
ncbi:hypothetical protein EXIGLDRAFT_693186 [Exidia glandulosa HHB12029]|uniref:Uncharacterized protein n=1 Tax=Exidia glandulosa HHB12029 TaxID=1314781 RepID=A0A166AHM7_EXIGL|nr:hypothetical protein EXIGLDRAFT_693186 [Exidia glandulosa HHB12029]